MNVLDAIGIHKIANSCPVNWGPLSHTNWSGNPNDANICLKTTMVSSTMVDFIRNIQPLRMRVNNKKEHIVLKRSCKIHMYALPWFSRPHPRVQWCFTQFIIHRFARYTALDNGLDVSVYTRPPHVAPCNGCHSHYTAMITTQIFQNSGPQLCGNYYMQMWCRN